MTISKKITLRFFLSMRCHCSHWGLHQKCEVTKILILDTKRIIDKNGNSLEAYTVKVTGNLIRDGALHGIAFHEPYIFEMQLVFLRNPNILSSGMLPLVLYDIQYSEKAAL